MPMAVALMQYQRPPINHIVLGLHKIRNYFIYRLYLYKILFCIHIRLILIIPLAGKTVGNTKKFVTHVYSEDKM